MCGGGRVSGGGDRWRRSQEGGDGRSRIINMLLLGRGAGASRSSPICWSERSGLCSTDEKVVFIGYVTGCEVDVSGPLAPTHCLHSISRCELALSSDAVSTGRLKWLAGGSDSAHSPALSPTRRAGVVGTRWWRRRRRRLAGGPVITGRSAGGHLFQSAPAVRRSARAPSVGGQPERAGSRHQAAPPPPPGGVACRAASCLTVTSLTERVLPAAASCAAA